MFCDHFDTEGIDRSRWNIVVTGPVYNEEQQAYVDSPDTITCAPGLSAGADCRGALVIQPRFQAGFVTSKGDTFRTG